MATFTFKAPSLFDAGATAEESNTVYHDAPGAGEALARRKRFAVWLNTQLVEEGLAAQGPDTDEGGWTISVSAAKQGFSLFRPKESGFVLIMISLDNDDSFELFTTEIGSAAAEHARVERALEKILRSSGEVSELEVSS